MEDPLFKCLGITEPLKELFVPQRTEPRTKYIQLVQCRVSKYKCNPRCVGLSCLKNVLRQCYWMEVSKYQCLLAMQAGFPLYLLLKSQINRLSHTMDNKRAPQQGVHTCIWTVYRITEHRDEGGLKFQLGCPHPFFSTHTWLAKI